MIQPSRQLLESKLKLSEMLVRYFSMRNQKDNEFVQRINLVNIRLKLNNGMQLKQVRKK